MITKARRPAVSRQILIFFLNKIIGLGKEKNYVSVHFFANSELLLNSSTIIRLVFFIKETSYESGLFFLYRVIKTSTKATVVYN